MKLYVRRSVLLGFILTAVVLFFVTSSTVRLVQREQQTPTELPSPATIIAYISVLGLLGALVLALTFYALRRQAIREKSLLTKESQSRKQIELLQDILTHDMRNYNQIAESNAEILKESLGPDQAHLADEIIKAVNGSSDLIERTKTMAKILATEGRSLKEVGLEDSINRSLSLVAKAYPGKSIILTKPLETRTKVIADDMLDQVFANVISNAVKYTNGVDVPIEIKVDEVAGTVQQSGGKEKGLVKVSVIDQGRGIPDGMKDRVFTRYQNSSSGSGLGLSIVHALITDRYSGRLTVSDRLPGDHTKGTCIEIWLRRA